MPEISRCAGVVIAIHYADRAPPHFHARYRDFEVTVALADGRVAGHFPRRKLRRVLQWYLRHREELAASWARAQERLPLPRIDPL